MTDEKYLFEQTARERKRNTRGSFAKKGRSRSKRCSLPSDYLTAKERKELNGVVETVNTMKVLSYDEWKKLSPSMKAVYIEALFEMHQARVIDIAEMWGKTSGNLCKTFKNYGIDIGSMSKKSRAYKNKAPDDSWLDFVASATALEGQDSQEPVEEESVAPAASDAVKHDDSAPSALKPIRLDVVSGSINYIGDPYAVFEKALLAVDPSKEYHFQIRFKEVTE